MCSKEYNRRSARIKARSEIIIIHDNNNNNNKTQIRKPKFLSLTLAISDSAAAAAEDKINSMPSNSTDTRNTPDPQQLNLFPLRPSSDDVDNVEYLLNSAAADGSATTLTSIFGAAVSTSSSTTSEDNNHNDNNHNHNHNHDLLARTALRKKERDRNKEERWVCYSEVMSSSRGCPPSSSSGGTGTGAGTGAGGGSVDGDHHDQMMMMKKKRRRRRLALKLDYEEIMNTWGRPLIHIQHEYPATVPDLINLHHHHHQSTVIISPYHTVGGVAAIGGWGYSNDGGLWRVPEADKRWCSNNYADNLKTKEEVENGQHLREASMLRYKEKRQSRLFSKRIRYQVRKINAEKRPRIKGRFVKRS